jgi:hypothetical protein
VTGLGGHRQIALEYQCWHGLRHLRWRCASLSERCVQLSPATLISRSPRRSRGIRRLSSAPPRERPSHVAAPAFQLPRQAMRPGTTRIRIIRKVSGQGLVAEWISISEPAGLARTLRDKGPLDDKQRSADAGRQRLTAARSKRTRPPNRSRRAARCPHYACTQQAPPNLHGSMSATHSALAHRSYRWRAASRPPSCCR